MREHRAETAALAHSTSSDKRSERTTIQWQQRSLVCLPISVTSGEQRPTVSVVDTNWLSLKRATSSFCGQRRSPRAAQAFLLSSQAHLYHYHPALARFVPTTCFCSLSSVVIHRQRRRKQHTGSHQACSLLAASTTDESRPGNPASSLSSYRSCHLKRRCTAFVHEVARTRQQPAMARRVRTQDAGPRQVFQHCQVPLPLADTRPTPHGLLPIKCDLQPQRHRIASPASTTEPRIVR